MARDVLRRGVRHPPPQQDGRERVLLVDGRRLACERRAAATHRARPKLVEREPVEVRTGVQRVDRIPMARAIAAQMLGLDG